MEFLSTIGPDALINTFAVNMKSNTDILICNEIQQLLFDETNGKRRRVANLFKIFVISRCIYLNIPKEHLKSKGRGNIK